MRDERMGARLVRCRILPPRLTRTIIKPGGCHLRGARMLVFIYADDCALLKKKKKKMSYTAASIVQGESKQVAYVALYTHFFD